MLTVEMLRQSTALTGLTDAQLTAIAEMSRNDENTVIGARIGELHGQYDADILAITGIAKNGSEKSYEYNKRVLNKYKADVEASKTLKTQLDQANAKVTDLEAKLAANAGNEALTQQLKDAKNQVTQLQTQLTTKSAELDSTKTEYETKIKNIYVDNAFAAATASIKFKPGITESVQKVLLASAKAEVLAKGTPDFIDDGKGGKTLVMRDASGNILNNAANNLNPFTIGELVMQTSIKDVIDTGRQQSGGGTGPIITGGGGSSVLDLSGCKTQIEADKAIESYLLASGITRDSMEFSDKLSEMRTENNVSDLPIR